MKRGSIRFIACKDRALRFFASDIAMANKFAEIENDKNLASWIPRIRAAIIIRHRHHHTTSRKMLVLSLAACAPSAYMKATPELRAMNSELASLVDRAATEPAALAAALKAYSVKTIAPVMESLPRGDPLKGA